MMRKINYTGFACLLLVFFTVSCGITNLPLQKMEVTVTPVNIFTATQTVTPTPIPSILVTELRSKYKDATWLKNKLQSMTGKGYLYEYNDVSPDGRWFVSLDPSTFLLELIPLDNTSKAITYQITADGNREMWVYSWSPDSLAFTVCVNYTHNPNGCQAIKLFEVSKDGLLQEHDIAWQSNGFQVLWTEYGDPSFISPYSGIFRYNKKGSLFNHSHLHNIIDTAWVDEGDKFSRNKILAIESSYDPITLDFLPSKIYELDGLSLESSEIYKSEFALSLLGSDLDAKYFLLEEFSPDTQSAHSIALFELKARSIIQRYILPTNIKISNVAQGNNQVAFSVETEGDDKFDIWVFDFKTRSIQVRGTGRLMGWYPDDGFLVNQNDNSWISLTP